MNPIHFQSVLREKLDLCEKKMNTFPEPLNMATGNIVVNEARTVTYTGRYWDAFLHICDGIRVGRIQLLTTQQYNQQTFLEFISHDLGDNIRHIGWMREDDLLINASTEMVYIYNKHSGTTREIASFADFVFDILLGPLYIPWASKSKDDWYTLLEDAGLVGEIT